MGITDVSRRSDLITRSATARPAAPAVSAPLAFALGAALAAGCGADRPDLFHVEIIDGIPHSVAADAPERGDASLELLWEAPSPDEIMDGAAWANPTQMAANDRGIAVLDPHLSREVYRRPATRPRL
jgi:hypothetical protein